MTREVRCARCGRVVLGVIPECDSCALLRLIERAPVNDGYARRDLARERVVYHKRD